MKVKEARLEVYRRWGDREEVAHIGVSLRTKKQRNRCTIHIRFAGIVEKFQFAAAPTWEEAIAVAGRAWPDSVTAEQVIVTLRGQS